MTKISEDRLRELSFRNAIIPHGDEVISMARELLSRRTSHPPSGEAGEPKVKPLEWTGGAPYVTRYSIAHTEIGEYQADHYEEQGGDGWQATYGDTFVVGHFPTEDEAKSACQSDYETRIRSALLPTIKEPTDGK
jgi:hypothetical protein